MVMCSFSYILWNLGGIPSSHVCFVVQNLQYTYHAKKFHFIPNLLFSPKWVCNINILWLTHMNTTWNHILQTLLGVLFRKKLVVKRVSLFFSFWHFLFSTFFLLLFVALFTCINDHVLFDTMFSYRSVNRNTCMEYVILGKSLRLGNL